MPSPFPGMDPYLEQAVFWASFHQRLLVAIADTIGPQLRPKYYADVETRTYFDDEDEELMVGIPDTLVLSPRRKPEAAFEVGTALTQIRPQQVQLPMSIEVRERFKETPIDFGKSDPFGEIRLVAGRETDGDARSANGCHLSDSSES